MAISIVGASASPSAGANPTVTVPVGVIQGDLLIIITMGTATPTTPAGWTGGNAQGASQFITIFYKYADATNASVVLTVGGATTRAVMLAYRGASIISGFATSTATGTSIASATQTTLYDNQYVVNVYASNNVAGTWTLPALTTGRSIATPTATIGGLAIADELQSAAGLSASRTATITASHSLSSAQFTIIPSGRYWVGGSGPWSTSTTNWSFSSGGASGAPAPTQADPVTFDQAGTYTVTMSGVPVCYGMIVSAGLVTFTSSATFFNYGSLSWIAGTVWANTGTQITFKSTTSGRTITTNGVTIRAPITFDGVGGTWNLSDTLTIDTVYTTNLTAGTLTLNGFDLNTGNFISTGTAVRAIGFGSNNIVLTQTVPGQTVLDMTIVTNYSFTGTPSFISDATVTRTYIFGTTGGTTANAHDLTFTGSGTALQTFTTGSWFKTLNFGTTLCSLNTTALNIAGNLLLSSGGTFTGLTPTMLVTSSITSNGKALAGLTINITSGTLTFADAPSLVTNGTVTLTSGILDLTGFNLNIGIFSSTGTSTRAIAFGSNNIILNHQSNAQTVLNMAIVTGFTWTGTGGFLSNANFTRTFTFGTTGGSITNAPNLIFTGSNIQVQTFTTGSWFNTLSFGTTAFALPATVLNVNALTLSLTGTYTSLGVNAVGTGSITPNGKSIAAFTVNNGAGTVTLAGALSVTTYTQTSGTIDFATFNLTCSGAGAFAAGTLNNIGTITCTTWTVAGAFSLSSGTLTPSTSFVLTSGSFTYNVGSTLSAVPTFTHTAGTVTLNQAYAMTATGTYTFATGTITLGGNLTTGIFSSAIAGARVINFSTFNIILAHTTAAQTVLNMPIVTSFSYTGTGGFTADASVTRTFTLGTTGGNSTIIPGLTFTGSGTAVQTLTTGSWFDTLDFGTTAFTIPATAINVDAIILSSSGTYTSLSVTMRSDGIFTPNGKTIAAFTVATGLGLITLTGALSCTTYTQTTGAIDFATFNLTCSGAAAYTAGTLTNIGTISCTTWTVTGAFTLSQGTLTPSVSFVLTSGSFTYSGGTLSPVPTFTHTAGTVTLGQNYSLTSGTGTYTLVAGTLTITDVNLITSAFITTGIVARSINFGTSGNGEITLTGNAKTIWDGGGAGITYTGTPRIVANYTGATGTRTVNLGTGWTEANDFDVTMQPSSSSSISGFQIINGSTDIIAMAGVVGNVSLTGFLFTFTPGVMTVYGDYTIDATGGTVSASASATTFASTNATARAISINRNIDFPITFNGIGGSWNLGSNLTNGVTRTTTLTAGTLNLNGNNLTTGLFSSAGTGVRSIAFGTNSITLTGNNATIWDGGSTGITLTGTPTIVSNYTGATGTRTINVGTNWTESTDFDVKVGSAVGISIGSGGTDTVAIAGVIGTLDLTGMTFTYSPGVMTVYGSYTIPATGGSVLASANLTTFASTQVTPIDITVSRSVDFPITFNGVGGTFNINASLTTGATRAMTLTAGSLVLSGSSSISTGTFLSTGTGTRSINFNNNNITLTNTVAATTVLSMADATGVTIAGSGGFISDLAVTKTFSFGSTAGGSTTNAPNLTFTTGAAVPTLTTGSWFNSLNFGTTTSSPSVTVISVSTLTLASGGNYTGLTPTFTRTQTWTPQFSKQLGGLGINIPGGTLTLGGTQSLLATATITLTAGTLDLGGFDLIGGIFSSSNTNTRAIAFGSNNITITHSTAAITVLAMADATNFTLTTSGGGFISNLPVTRTFTFGSTAGGTATNSPNLAITSGAAIPTLTSGSWFNTLNFTGTTATPAVTTLFINTLTLATGGTYTGLTPIFTRTQTWTSQFSKQLDGIGFNLTGGTLTLDNTQTYTATSSCNLITGTLDLGGVNLTIGRFISSYTDTRAIAFGSNNIVLGHTTAATTRLSMAIATGFTWTGTGGFVSVMGVTATFTFGTTGGTASNAPNLSLSGASIPTISSGSYWNKLDFTGSTGNLLASQQNIAGNLILATGGTYSNVTTNMVSTSNQIITGLAKTLAAVNVRSGTTTISDTLTSTGIFLVESGTFTHSAGAILNAATVNVTNSGTVNLNGGTLPTTAAFNHTLGTVNVTVSTSLTATSTYTFAQGALSLSDGVTLSTGIFSSTNSNTRSIAFGNTTAGNISLTHTTAATVRLGMSVVTGFTWTGVGGFVSAMGVTASFNFGGSGGGSTSNAVNLSLSGGAAIPTFTTGGWFNLLDFTGSTSIPAATVLNLNALTLATGGTYTALGATMVGTGTITPAGKTIAAFTVNNGAGTVTLAATLGVTTYTQTAGTIDFATFNLTCSGAAVFTAGTLNNIGTISCTTWAETGTFTLSSGTISASTSFTVTSGAFTYNGGTITTPSFVHTAGTVTTTTPLTLPATCAYTLTTGTLTLGGSLTTGAFVSTGTGVRSIDWNTYSITLNHSTAATTVLSMAIVTNYTFTGTQLFISDAAVTRTFVFGTTGGSATIAPSLTLTGSGTAVGTFTTGSWFNTLDFGTTTYTVAATTLNLNTLILSSTGTSGSISATMRGTGSILCNSGGTTKALTNLVINHSGTTTLGINVNPVTYTQTSGTIDFAGFNLTCSGAAAYTSGTLNNIGTISCTTWTVTGAFTFGQGTITPSTSFVLTSGSFTYDVGATLSAVPTFTHTAGTVTLNQSYALTATGTYTLTTGTLTLGGDLTTGIFTSLFVGNIRTISFGTNNIYLVHTTAAQTVLSLENVGLSWTGTGGFSTAMTVTRTFRAGGTPNTLSAGVNLFITSGSSAITFTAGDWYSTLDFTGSTSSATVTASSVNVTTLVLGGGTYGFNVVTYNSGTLYSNGKAISTLVIGNNAYSLAPTVTTLLDAASCSTCAISTSGPPTFDFATFNLTCSSTFSYPAGTLSNIGTITCTTFTVNGPDFNFTSGTINPSTSFVLTSGSFTYNVGSTLSAVPTFTHTAGTVTLNKSYALTATGTYTLTSGVLTLVDNITLTTGIFSSTGTSTRAITFGDTIASNIVLSHTIAATTVLSMADCSNFVWSGPGGFISPMSVTRTFLNGTTGSTSGSIALNGTSQYLQTAANLAVFQFTGSAAFTIEAWIYLTNYTTYNNIVSSDDNNAGNPGEYNFGTNSSTGVLNFSVRSTLGVLENYNSGTVIPLNTWTHVAVCRATGGASKFFVNGVLVNSFTTTSSVSGNDVFRIGRGASASTNYFAGNISNLRIVKGVDVYTGNFTVSNSPLTITQSASTNIKAITGSQTSLLLLTPNNAFFAKDTSLNNITLTNVGAITASALTPITVLPAAGQPASLALTSGAAIPTFTTGSYFYNLDFTGSSTTPAATTVGINNNLTLSSGGTYTGLTINLRGTGTLTSTGKTISALTLIASGTNTVADALTISGALTLTQGSLDSNYNITSGSFASTGTAERSIIGSITYTITGSGATAFSNAAAAGISMPGTTINMSSGTAKTFAGGGGSYYTLNQGGAGTLSITGANEFYDITNTVSGTTVTFPSGVTQTFSNFNLRGNGSGDVNGYPLGSIVFNGTNKYLSLPANTAFNFGTGEFTLECWVYPLSFTTASETIDLWSNVSGSYIIGQCQIQVNITTGTISFVYATSTTITATVTTTTTIPLNAWTHIAAVRVGTTVTVYINGVSSASATVSQVIGTTGAGSIGRQTGTNTLFFNGYISNVRVVKGIGVYTGNFSISRGPLSSTQSASTNTTAITGTQTSLLLNTPNNANFIKDNSTNNFTLTNNGSIVSNNISPFLLYITASTPGSAATLYRAVGTVNVDYLTIKDSAATGGLWYGGNHSFDVSNNSGWYFYAQPPIVSSVNYNGFFAFF